MMKYFLLLIFLASASFASSEQRAKKILKDFDLAYYHPHQYGLRDFKVDIRIDGLSKKLNKQQVFGKINDVFFELSWRIRDNLNTQDYKKVKVFGMPNGFFEVKSQLTIPILQALNFLVPIPISDMIKGYKLSMKNSGGPIICKDPENLRDINEIILTFGKTRKLKKLIMKSPTGIETIDLILVKKPWSKGKWVISEHRVTKDYGPQIIKLESHFSYKVIAGLGFPEKIQTTTQQIFKSQNPKKSSTYKNKIISEMRLSNWRVNTGIKKSEFVN